MIGIVLVMDFSNKYVCWGSPPVRRASANVVSIVAKYAVPAGEWPDLLPFLFQCSQSSHEDHREVSSHLTRSFN